MVESVGAGVTRFTPGDRVFTNLTNYGHGAFAEYACALGTAWAPIPSDVSFEVAATLPEASVIAYQGLRGGRTIERGAQGPHQRGVGQRRAVRGPAREHVRRRGDRRLQHAEGGLRSIAGRGPCHRLHPRRLHAHGPALRLHPGRVGEAILPCASARAQAVAVGTRWPAGARARSSRAFCLDRPCHSSSAASSASSLWWKPFDPTDIAHAVRTARGRARSVR